MSTLEFGDYFSTRDAKDYRSMTSAELDEEIKYTEEILDFHRSLNGSGDPVLRGFIETDLKSLLAEKARRTGASKNSNPGSKSIRKWIDLMESIEEQEIDWLWRDRIARGRLTEFLGDPGIGKSHASQAIAADLSVGRALPGDVEPEAPLRTLILNFEDGAGDTIKPHLRMLGADMTMVGVPAKSNRLLPSQFNANILENMLREFPAALVVVDPALAIMSKRNTDRASDVRDVLSPLADLAMCKKFKPPFFSGPSYIAGPGNPHPSGPVHPRTAACAGAAGGFEAGPYHSISFCVICALLVGARLSRAGSFVASSLFFALLSLRIFAAWTNVSLS